eukprot:SAG11_NODE_1490_length_4810_cov_4.090851_1_plen_86_part_00
MLIRHSLIRAPAEIYMYIRRYRPKNIPVLFPYIAGTAAVARLCRELLLPKTIVGTLLEHILGISHMAGIVLGGACGGSRSGKPAC